VSSHYAGLACTSFPTCDGEQVVPTWQGLVGIHVLHRLNGFLLLAGYAVLAWQTRQSARLGALARLGAGLVVVQIAVGALNVLLRLPEALTGLHTGVAAAIVLTTGLVVREVLRTRSVAEPRASVRPRILEAR
jgi:cytochrome c oxidase assembly protein subunit 15